MDDNCRSKCPFQSIRSYGMSCTISLCCSDGMCYTQDVCIEESKNAVCCYWLVELIGRWIWFYVNVIFNIIKVS